MAKTISNQLAQSLCICTSKKSRRKCKPENKICGNWDGAIQDAKNRIKELRFSIRVFKEKLKRKEPWPG
jgi:hypothetical protein